MEIELSTPTETAPIELLDVQVQSRPEAGRSLLSVQFICQPGRGPQQHDRMKMPPLTWLDASRLQQFTQYITAANRTDEYQIDLPDAGLRLSSVGVTRANESRRQIRIEPLAAGRFVPLIIRGTTQGFGRYARLLYQRLWDAFCRG